MDVYQKIAAGRERAGSFANVQAIETRHKKIGQRTGENLMYRSLSSFIPNAVDLLALEVEELAGVLLMHLNSYEGVSGNSVYQHGGISYHNFFNSIFPPKEPEYGDKQPQVDLALMEAWGMASKRRSARGKSRGFPGLVFHIAAGKADHIPR